MGQSHDIHAGGGGKMTGKFGRKYGAICILGALLFGMNAATVPANAQTNATAKTESYAVTLNYAPPQAAKSVTVAGTFNGWNKTANPLAKSADGKTWTITLNLEPNVYQYKFVVDGETWTPDPNSLKLQDPEGNTNSLLMVAPPDFKTKPAKVGDGIITESALLHVVNSHYVTRIDKTHFSIVLRTRRDDVESATIARIGSEVKMRPYRSDALFTYWRGIVPITGGNSAYMFVVQDGKNDVTLNTLPIHMGQMNTYKSLFHAHTADFPVFETPDWAQDAVFYQIFPDRFANGDKSNDPKDVQEWGAKPTYFSWMGGDLRGVMNHWDYLKSLGINALYFNPLFAARSNHAYDTTDYLQIDPRFGTNADLKELTTKARKDGMRVILDAVFNHTGVDFAGFKSLQTEREKSAYRDWYFVRGFPLEVKDGQKNYDGWYGSPWMPKLNVLNPPTRDYLLSAATYWIKSGGIDGWRLDAADEVNPEFWKRFRRAVKSVKPDAFIVGERWNDAAQWLQGDQWDSAMNYPLCFAVRDFFASDRGKPSEFDARLSQIREAYPPAATAVMFNILDSHDTERIRTVCGGNMEKEKQAILFQMTYPGVPCVYYGDEIGMEGGKDPDNRRGFDWTQVTPGNDILNFYKKAIVLRNQHPCLRRGDFETVIKDDAKGVYGFTRTYEKESALVLFNRSDTARRVSLDASILARYSKQWFLSGAVGLDADDSRALILPPRGMVVLGAVAK